MTPSAIYVGHVSHHRRGDLAHDFTYRSFSLLVDLDALPDLDRGLRLFSHNRFNLFSFHDRDHGARDGSPLRPWIDARLRQAGIALDGGPVRLLCFPRILGYVFDPISVWFCHHRDGTLRAVLYEVRNTFGEAHAYLIPVEAEAVGAPVIRQSCAKRFHVSPFIALRGRYRFKLRVPDARMLLTIRQTAPDGQELVAVQSGNRRALRDRALLRVALTHPLLTLKVIGGIHWEAFRLWRKGARFHRKPAPPASPVSLGGESRLPAAE